MSRRPASIFLASSCLIRSTVPNFPRGLYLSYSRGGLVSPLSVVSGCICMDGSE